MKSFKKVIAGVCSLIMFSTVATCAVSAELGDSLGDSNDTVVAGPTTGESGNDKDDTQDSTVGDSKDKDDTQDPTVGDSKDKDDTQDPTIGDSKDKDDTQDPTIGDSKDKDKDNVPQTPTYVVGTSKIVGDINNDDDVNAMDLLLLRKYVLSITSEINVEAADINNDGQVLADDLLLLRKYVLSIISSFDAYRA